MSASMVDDLRRQLREKFPQACGAWAAEQGGRVMDEGGGFPHEGREVLEFPAGMVSEVVGLGAGWVVAGLLARMEEEPGVPELVLVDGADGFDPASFSGRECARMLWVRCRKSALEMVKAADWLVRDGNVPLVLVDATGLERKELAGVPAAAWWRLKQGAERTGCRLVVVAANRLVPSAGRRWNVTAGLGLADFEATREELLGRLAVVPERLRQVT